MKTIKYLIVGAGPAGLQMGYFLQKAGLNYLIIEKDNTSGSFFKKYPIHRNLISINKKHNYFTEETFNLRHDWNSLLSDDPQLKFTNYSDELFPNADVLYGYLNDFATKHHLKIQYNTTIKHIIKEQDLFKICFENDELLYANIVLIGTGITQQNIPQGIEGIENTISYSKAPTDKKAYINKRVAIIGGGNSAFETANNIADVAAHVHILLRSPLKMAHETHFVGHLRAKYTNLFDMYQLKSLHAILKPNLKKITLLDNGCLRTNHEYEYPESNIPGTLKLNREYDFIINCTGFVYTQSEIFDASIMPETVMNGKFYDLNEFWESKNIENLFFIGTAMQAIDRKASSGFIHGFRYNIRTLSNLLLEKFEHQPYPFETVKINPFKDLLEKLYTRFSIGDAIFQLYGFLGDMLVYDEQNESLQWYQDLPVQHIKSRKPKDKHVLQLTLEFGFHHYPNQSSMSFMGPSDPHNTAKAVFLHPVIRHFYNDLQDEFHFGDSLLGRWDMPHAAGGAIASYHTEFYNWMADIFEIELIDISAVGENPIFEKWS
jgi:thioredoxin reductase